jgi:hypothetical protein
LKAQNPNLSADAIVVDQIYDQALTDSRCYEWLRSLSFDVGHRISGSAAAEKAVVWAKNVLDTMRLDTSWLQPCMVPKWVRGDAEQVFLYNGEISSLPALALGGSIGTGGSSIKAEVVEIKRWEDLDKFGERNLRGKIVFYNRPMDPTKIRTFEAYGGCVDQRVHGASRAAKYGAVGVIVRSMGLRLDDFPHTGSMHYDSAYTLIPGAAISTLAAEKLSKALKANPKAQVSMKFNCHTFPDVPSSNVIGEIRGTEFPNKFITVGGHLDSWDVGHGAHDDGAGVVQSMDVLHLLQKIGYKPRHTIRCVLFMNEENGLRGGKAYAAEAIRKNETHVCAIESDAGGFTPRAFTFESDESVIGGFYEKVKLLEPLFEPYGLKFARGGSGADIGPLRSTKALLSGYSPDSQRYFDYHHTADDTFDKVNKRELELGAASMAALIYLIDKYGL